ncbi:MAG: nitronate monooxygenase [Dehalococcoidia bacterium]|nr:nitronate monooxygenase [Dehalococcoidia bacterium]
MKKTRVCELLGIEYPIIQAPMAWITGPRLVAAVSNAGGLGTIGPNPEVTHVSTDVNVVADRLRRAIRKTKELTRKPFAVNVPVGVGQDRLFSEKCAEVVMEEKVPVAIVSVGGPGVYTKRFKDAGLKVIHVTASVKHAKGAEAAGVDAVVCQGYESGGYSGFDELTTFVLVPQAVDALKIPVIAGGGIADGRGMAAVMALGAEGVYVGTRFLLTEECDANPKVKEAAIRAGDTDTISWGRKIGLVRTLKNALVLDFLKRELGGASPDDLRAFLGSHRIMKALVEGDLEQGAAAMGADAGMIGKIEKAGDVVREMVRGADMVTEKLQSLGQAAQGK